MSELSENQEELRRSIQKSAIIWGLVLGVIAGLIAYWIMGSQTPNVRLGGSVVLGAGAGFAIFRWIFNSRARSAKCTKCGAAFSISRTNREETLVSSEEKEEREKQEDGSTKVNRWKEEKFDVVETYECSSCADVTTKTSQTTRRRDEESIVEPAPVVKSAATGAPGAKGRPGRAQRGKPAPKRADVPSEKPKNTASDPTRQ